MRTNRVVRDHFLRRARLIQDLLMIEHSLRQMKNLEGNQELLELLKKVENRRKPKKFRIVKKRKRKSKK